MEEYIPRWILGSASRHFSALKTANFKMFVEGQIRDTRKIPNFFELRFDGPDKRDFGTVIQYDFTLNIIVSVTLDTGDTHGCQTYCGIVQKKFPRRLIIYSIPEENDDYVLEVFACASLIPDHKGRDVRIFQFGQVNPTTLIQRASVMGQYRLTLEQSMLVS